MDNILSFLRNRCTSVEEIDEHTLKSTCRLQDTLMDAVVEITVRLPDLEITDVKGEVYQSYRKEWREPADYLKKITGVRIGPGMLKIIKGLIGKTSGCKQLVFMVEECCHGVILSFTKESLVDAPRPRDIEEAKEFYAEMVRENVRLYNRCAAFAPGSSLVEGLDLQGNS